MRICHLLTFTSIRVSVNTLLHLYCMNTSPSPRQWHLGRSDTQLRVANRVHTAFFIITSTPLQLPITASTGLVHALRYGFIIFVLSYSVTLLDVRPEAPVYSWCVSAYLCRDCVIRYCLLYTFLLTVITDSPRETTAGRSGLLVSYAKVK